MEQKFVTHYYNVKNGLTGEERVKYVEEMVNKHIVMLPNRETADEDQF